MGYSGYERQGGSFLGFEGKPHQIVGLFKQEGTKLLRTERANPGLLPEPDSGRAAFEANRASTLMATREQIAKAETVRKLPASPELDKIESHTADLEAEIKALDASGSLDPGVRDRLMKTLEDRRARGEIEDKAYKAAFYCLTKGG
jgi:hypothetical protein